MASTWRQHGTAMVAAATMFIASICIGCTSPNAATTDVEGFCAQASANRDLIVRPPLTNDDEIRAAINFYRLMGQLGPLQLADDWQHLAEMMETANDIVPGDADSERLVAQAAYAGELSAYNIATWVQANCGVTLPITTIVPHDPQSPAPPQDTYVPTTAVATTAPATSSVDQGSADATRGPSATAVPTTASGTGTSAPAQNAAASTADSVG